MRRAPNPYLFFPGVWLAACAASVLACRPLVAVPLGVLAADGVFGASALAGLVALLARASGATARSALPRTQKYVNYGGLLLLFAACRTGAEYLLLYTVFPPGTAALFVPLLPAKIVVALLVGALAALTAARRAEEAAAPEPGTATAQPEPEDDPPASAAPSETIGQVAVRSGAKVEVIPLDEVVALQAEGDYVAICTPHSRFLKEQTMKYFAERLPPGRYVRIHRSAIVATAHIVRIESYEKGQQTVVLTGGLRVRASASGYKELKKALDL